MLVGKLAAGRLALALGKLLTLAFELPHLKRHTRNTTEKKMMEVEAEQDLFESFAAFLCFAEANLKFCRLPLSFLHGRYLRGHAASERKAKT